MIEDNEMDVVAIKLFIVCKKIDDDRREALSRRMVQCLTVPFENK